MVSTTAIRGGDSLAVDVASTAPTASTTLLPLPHASFSSCPTQHGLSRSNDENLLQAIVSSISYRLEKLSLSDEPALESPTATIYHPVYTARPAGTDSTPSKDSARPSLRNIKPKLVRRFANSLKTGLQKSIRKRTNTRKTQAPIPPLPVSPCSPVEHQDSFRGQIVDFLDGLPASDVLGANPCGRDTWFRELPTFAVRGSPTQQVPNPTFLQPVSPNASSSASIVPIPGDEVAEDAMDEDEQQLPSARPASPIPMDLEGTEASSDASLDPESPQAPFEESSDRDTRASVPELTDSIMSDGEQTLSNSEAAHSMEPTDTVMIDAASPTVFRRGINIDEAEDRKNPRPLERTTMDFVRPTQDSPAADQRIQSQVLETNPGRDSAPATSSELPPPPTQPLPSSSPYNPTEPIPAVKDDRNIEPVPTQRQAALAKSTQTAPASISDAYSTSTVAEQAAVPSNVATKSTAGPSTSTPTSSQSNPTNTHASRVHQLLGKLTLSKKVSKSAKDEASEEAEAEAFLANIASRREPPKPQTKPAHPHPSSHPRQTKAGASRSLVEDIMAGFRKATNPKSPQKQVAAAIQPSLQRLPGTTNALSISPTAATQPSIPVVAVRQPGSNPALPFSVGGNGCQAAASPSGRAPSTISPTGKVLSTSPTPLPAPAGLQSGPQITPRSSVVRTGRQAAASPSGRAPSTLSATENVNGPLGSVPTQAGTPSEAGPHGPSNETSEAAMDGVESRRRAIKGSRRVARAMAKTKVTWQTVQQMARQNQAALETAQPNTAASTSATSLKSDEEELRLSRQWHAAQPPPPPEAMPFINTKEEEYDGEEEEYDGDPDDFDALLAWTLTHGN